MASYRLSTQPHQLASRWFETTLQEDSMTSPETVQMERYNSELEDDMRHILKKYSRIMGWGIPELDEAAARRLILGAMRQALAKVEGE
jgi:hypothetical protein